MEKWDSNKTRLFIWVPLIFIASYKLSPYFYILIIGDFSSELERLRNLVLAAAAVPTILLLTWRSVVGQQSLNETVKTNEKSHIRDLYSKAIEFIGSDKQTIRLAGIKTLKEIAKADPATYLPTIMDILYTFVREVDRTASSIREQGSSTGEEAVKAENYKKDYESQVYAAIGLMKELREKDAELRIDFRSVHVKCADLTEFNLNKADFRNSSFEYCTFYGSNLTDALLNGADFNNSRYNSREFIVNEYPYYDKTFKPTIFPADFDPSKHGMRDVIELLRNKNVVEDIKEKVKEPAL